MQPVCAFFSSVFWYIKLFFAISLLPPNNEKKSYLFPMALLLILWYIKVGKMANFNAILCKYIDICIVCTYMYVSVCTHAL